jgi:hypothetical protein
MGRAISSARSAPVSRIGWALALVAAGATAAAAGTIGYKLGGWHKRAAPPAAATTHVVAPARDPSVAAPVTAVSPSSAAATAGSAPSQAEPEPEELLLLGEARSAVAERDFATALVLLTEHARRFENGMLTEEREALLVRTLSGLGRAEEARRAADAFETRFPHSVLVRAIRRRMAAPDL